jgi:co-chaperonin GroES (HSP10)
MQIKAKGRNIIAVRYEKPKSENFNGLISPSLDNNSTVLSKVISIGKDVTEVNVDEIIFVPVTAIKVVFDTTDYFICHEENIMASLV